jgi:Ca2+-binding EF-hand superfamily protein
MGFFSVAFNMYDMDNDGVISKDELCAFLTLMIGGNISNEQVRHFDSIFLAYNLQGHFAL